MANNRICSITGCGKPNKAKGFCTAHYKRLRRHGDPLGGARPAGDLMRFMVDVVFPYQSGACLKWPFPVMGTGYGQISVDGKMHLAHRFACEKIHGSPPTKSHQAAHSCGNRWCVNPAHLSWKTQAGNEADKIIHGRSNRGERCGSAKLSVENVLAIRRLFGTKTNEELGRLFGVRASQISRIGTRSRWAHI
ncbi:HNH endonuclease [Shinella sp.]|uniref:HNH endonuclease n=1 Tax=Shinella sp. TaxID=1870904 RepID=UPI003D270535